MHLVSTPRTRNLQGQHGPRCPVCSGWGAVLPLGTPGPAKRLSTVGCVCKGTGLDLDAVRDARESAILAELQRLGAVHADREREAASLRRRLDAMEAAFARWQPPQVRNSRQYWTECIAWATGDGTAVANTTTETIIFPNVTLPGGYMQDGRLLEIEAAGRLSTTGTPTMTWAIRWGGVSSTLLATTEAITMGSGVTNVSWSLRAKIQTRTNGATGSLFVMGEVKVHTSATAVSVNVFGVSGHDAPAAVSALDLTADTPLSITADWSAASASNTLTGHMYDVTSHN